MSTTDTYAVDAWAWIEYLRSSTNATLVNMIENSELITSAVTLSEVISKLERNGFDVQKAFEALTSLSKITDVKVQAAREAGLLHAEIKKKHPNFGLTDAFVLQLAREMGAKVLTGDPDFEGIKDVELIRKP